MLIELHNKLPEEFRVLAIDHKDQTYFVENITLSKYFWCYAEQTLRVGQKLDGEINPPKHPEDYPVLVALRSDPEKSSFGSDEPLGLIN